MPVVLNYSICQLLLLLALCETAGIVKPITCHAGTFAPDESAEVTCNLHAVSNANGSGVHMVRYQPGASQLDPGENVLACSWVEKMQRHQCNVEMDGYTFNNDSDSAIAVTIASVKNEFAGLYVCFLVPSHGTQAHPCELIVRGGTLPRTTTPETTVTKPDTWMIGFIVVLTIALILMATLCGFYLRRRLAQRPQGDDHVELGRLIDRGNERNQEQGQKDVQETDVYPNKRIMVHLNRLLVGQEEINTLMQAVQKELVAYSTSQKTRDMFCTKVKALPNKTETGTVLVINLSSRCLKVLIVKLCGADITSDEYMTYNTPADVRTGTSQQLMDFITDRVRMFLESNDLLNKRLSVGFVLSFPCSYQTDGDLTTARVARWTKGFRCKEIEGNNWKDLLQHALKTKKVGHLEINAIVNDLVALFMAAVREDEKCSIAVILGSGFGACYLQQKGDQSTSGHDTNSNEQEIVSMESGAFGEDNSLDDLRTEFDITLDQNSLNKGKQIDSNPCQTHGSEGDNGSG